MIHTFLNLSAHPVVFCDAKGKEIFSVPASGSLGEIKAEVNDLPPIRIEHEGEVYSIPLVDKVFKDVCIPPPKPGVIYLTSTLIAEKAARDDVLAPHEKVRDKDGNVIGRISLVRFSN